MKNSFWFLKVISKAVISTLLFVFLALQINSLQAEEAAPEWRYSVRPNDNLIQFAKQYLLNPDDWRTLQTLNHIKNPKRMQFGQVLRVPLALMKQLPASAEVALATGKAGILKADNSLQSVAIGQQLGAGTVLITGDNSKLNIKLADGSIVSMQPNSTLKLDTLSMYSGGGMVDTKLRLQQGKLETEANPAHVQGNSMQIITPTAVAAVRGTKFRVSTDDISIRQETLEGKVGLIAAGEEIGVAKGYGSLAEGGNAPLPPVLLLPAPSTQQLPKLLDALPVSFNLQVQDGAVAWVAKVSPDVQFNAIAATSQTDPTGQGATLSFNDLPDGHYYLKVRAKDGKGLEGYDATHEFTLHARPFAPTASAPASGAIVRDTKPELAWKPVEQAKKYQLELAQNADFKQPIENHQLAENKFKLEKDLPPGQYFWRLASIDGDNQGPYMPTASFTIKPMPPAPNVSQLTVKVFNNAVFVHTINPPEGLRYEAILHNEKNQQKSVWQGQNLGAEFDFLLKEYGKQTLVLRHIEADGTAGPDSIFEFDASPP
jgi:hypothetical protein